MRIGLWQGIAEKGPLVTVQPCGSLLSLFVWIQNGPTVALAFGMCVGSLTIIEEAYVGALAVVVAIRLAILLPQFPGRSLLTLTAASLPETNIKERVLALAALAPDTPIAEVAQRFGASGYVVESVPLALYAAQQTKQQGFVVVLEQLIAAGGDTDTNAAIAGQIAGAWLGLDAIPQTLIQQLPDREAILATSRAFADWVTRKGAPASACT